MQVQDVDLRLLRIFVAIVESGGLSAAESRLNIGRSTISAHLSDLEIRLGVTLCKRGRSGFEVTESGNIVYQASLELLQQCEAFTATIANSKNELTGRVSIAIIDNLVTAPNCALSKVIANLNQQSEHIQFDINICEAREVETAVMNGRSLVGFGVSRHALRGLDYFPLFHETNFLYCSEQHPLFNGSEQQIKQQITQARVISSNYLRDKETRNDGLNYHQGATAFHDEGIAHLILSGQFIGYLPEHYARYWTEKGLFKAILPEQYHYQIPVNLITAKNQLSSPLYSELLAEIKRCHQAGM